MQVLSHTCIVVYNATISIVPPPDVSLDCCNQSILDVIVIKYVQNSLCILLAQIM